MLGFRRGWDRTQWSLLVTAFAFGTGIGTILLPSIMGALLGGMLIYLLTKTLIRFSHSAAYYFTLYMIVFIGLGRLGCLFSGCCFGSVTDLPWGITYSAGNLAHWLHLHSGQITQINNASLAIHAIQLYESIFLLCFALPLVLVLHRKQIAGRVLLAGFISSYFLLRFGLEFFRDMSNVWWSEIYWVLLSVFQIFLLCMSLTALGITRYVYIHPKTTSSDNTITVSGGVRLQNLLMITFIFGTCLLSNYFQRIQVVLLLILLSFTIYQQVLHFLISKRKQHRESSRIAWGTLTLLLLFNTSAQFLTPDGTMTPLLNRTKWLYGINEHNNKLIRMGAENLTFNQYVRINSILQSQPLSPQIDSLGYTSAVKDIQSNRTDYFFGSSYANQSFQVSTCGGDAYTRNLETYAFVAGIEKEIRTKEHNYTYLNTRLDFLYTDYKKDGQYEGTLRLLTWLSSIGFEKKYLGAGIGPGMNFSSIPDSIDIQLNSPSAGLGVIHLRLGPQILFLEIGANDRYYIQPGAMGIHMNIGHTSRKGPRFQLGLGSMGPDSRSMGWFVGAKNLRLSKNVFGDFNLIFMDENLDLGTSVVLHFPIINAGL
ncbi:prolipoprotein diacylglyceryl transferase [bacterium]|nr:prolipoprotein diacylglyceryl transferase [bacterium]